jgi:hypothetical protein
MQRQACKKELASDWTRIKGLYDQEYIKEIGKP